MEIIYNDKWLSLCIKDPGVLSEEEMPALLKEATGREHYCVHRLDRAVGGLMVYASDKKSAAKLSGLIAQKEMEKEYLAVISGKPEAEKGLYRDLLFKDSAKNKSYVVKRMRKGVREAELEYEVLEHTDGLSLVKIRLRTGRSHQIRVQFSSRAMPLAGDVKYGSSVKDCGIALWSYSLSFPHPASGESMKSRALPPKEYPWNKFNTEI